MPSKAQRAQRIVVGLVTAIAVLLVFDALPTPFSKFAQYRLFDYFYVWPSVFGLPMMFAAAFSGAIVARVNFVGPAVSLAVVTWLVLIYFVNSIAVAAGQGAILEVAATNLIGLISRIVGAVFGANSGRWFFGRSEDNVTNAA